MVLSCDGVVDMDAGVDSFSFVLILAVCRALFDGSFFSIRFFFVVFKEISMDTLGGILLTGAFLLEIKESFPEISLFSRSLILFSSCCIVKFASYLLKRSSPISNVILVDAEFFTSA